LFLNHLGSEVAVLHTDTPTIRNFEQTPISGR
jgi:hypothetical protein